MGEPYLEISLSHLPYGSLAADSVNLRLHYRLTEDNKPSVRSELMTP